MTDTACKASANGQAQTKTTSNLQPRQLSGKPSVSATGGRASRNSTIELLRIVCMLLVIAHHGVVHGGSLTMDSCANKVIASLVLPGGKIAFTCFVAISMWFLVDQRFRAARFLRSWLEVLFYSVLMAAVSALLGAQLSGRDWLGTLLPIGGNTHGFAATYLVFYLLLPVLSRLADGLTRKQVIWIGFVLLYAQVIEPILALFGFADLSLHPFVSEITLFALCYFIALYLRRWPPRWTREALIPGVIVLVVWLAISALTVVQWVRSGNTAPFLLAALASNESSILYIVGGFSLFLCFNALPMTSFPVINKVAGTTFGILLIHDASFFRYVLWDSIVRAPLWWYDVAYPLCLGAATIAIFCIGAIVDLLRQQLLETPLARTSVFARATEAMDSIWVDAPRGSGDSEMPGDASHACVNGEGPAAVSRRSALTPQPSERATDVVQSVEGDARAACNRARNTTQILLWLIPVATLIFATINLITRSTYLSSYFVSDWNDTFMDYFSMLENVRVGDPYYAYSNYPALNFVILKVLFHLVPHSSLVSLDNTREEALALRDLMPSMLGFIALFMVCLVVIVLCVMRSLRSQSGLTRISAALAVLFSGPLLFLLERGNLLMLSFTAVMVFFTFWRSKKTWQRRLACAALAFAAALKLYPAVFLLLLLRDRRLKEFFATTILFLILLVAPFFLFGGFGSIVRFVQGIAFSSSEDWGLGYNYSFANLLRMLLIMLGLGDVELGILPSLAACAVCLIAFVLARHDWERILICGVLCVWVPAFSYTYGLVMIVPALISLAAHKEPLRGYETLSMILLVVLMMPLATARVDSVAALNPEAKFPLSWGCALGNLVLLALVLLVFVRGITALRPQIDPSYPSALRV